LTIILILWLNDNGSQHLPAAMYVCLCNGVTEREIRQTAAGGCRTMAELTMRTGCGAGCGSCVCMATEILEEVHGAAAAGDGIAHAA
jgi:bacterioferritin-associated ferredoxin